MIRNNHANGWDDLKNSRNILACLESMGPLSRATVAKKLDLSRTTLTNLIIRLIDLRLVTELEGGDPNGRGRPGIPVDLDTSAWFALGAAFHSGHWVFVVTNLRGEVVAKQTGPACSGEQKSVLASLVKGLGAMLAKPPGKLLPAVGIGAPGLVNADTGTVIRADDLGWQDVDIAGAIGKATGLDAFVVNRNRAAAVAEARYGSGRGVANFVYIGVGTGISAAIMLDGELLHGSTYSAGEIGHIVVDPRGPECGCGNRGCLQTLAAEKALVRMAVSLSEAGKLPGKSPLAAALAAGGLDGAAICAAAMAGDKTADACVRSAAAYLGREVGNLITTLNPEKVVLGGPLIRAGSILVDYVREEAAAWAMKHPLSSVVIEAGILDEYAGARGAACLVLKKKLELCMSTS